MAPRSSEIVTIRMNESDKTVTIKALRLLVENTTIEGIDMGQRAVAYVLAQRIESAKPAPKKPASEKKDTATGKPVGRPSTRT